MGNEIECEVKSVCKVPRSTNPEAGRDDQMNVPALQMPESVNVIAKEMKSTASRSRGLISIMIMPNFELELWKILPYLLDSPKLLVKPSRQRLMSLPHSFCLRFPHL